MSPRMWSSCRQPTFSCRQPKTRLKLELAVVGLNGNGVPHTWWGRMRNCGGCGSFLQLAQWALGDSLPRALPRLACAAHLL